VLLELLASRLLLPRDAIRAAGEGAYLLAWGVAGVTQLTTLTALRDALLDVIREGGTLADWRDSLEEILASTGWGTTAWHAETIFRTTLASVMESARYLEIAGSPHVDYLVFDAINDDRVRDEHLALDGFYWRKEEFPPEYWPPLGYNCRCSVVPADADELEDLGAREAHGTIVDEDGVPIRADEGFRNAPSVAALSDELRESLLERLAAAGWGEVVPPIVPPVPPLPPTIPPEAPPKLPAPPAPKPKGPKPKAPKPAPAPPPKPKPAKKPKVIPAPTPPPAPEGWRDFADDAHEASRWWSSSTADAVRAGVSGYERAALWEYTGGKCAAINRFLSTGTATTFTREQIEGWVNGIDAAIGRATIAEDVVVYRGTSARWCPLLDDVVIGGPDFDPADLVGKRWHHPAFVSTSASRARSFRGELLVRIRVPAGTPAIYVANVSQYSSELEVLLGRGLRFEVVGATIFNKTKLLLDLEVIP